MMLISSIGLTFGIGGGNYISRLLGRTEYDKANKVATISIGTTLILRASLKTSSSKHETWYNKV